MKNNSRHLFFLMNHVFIGFGLAVAYGVLTAIAVWLSGGTTITSKYLTAFFGPFNGAITGGLIFSASILVWRSQSWIPNLIDEVFGEDKLALTEYPEQKRRFFAASRSISFSTTFVVIGFGVFSLTGFPLKGLANLSLLIFACIQYGLGVYIGRKLFYIAQMLHAIEDLDPGHDIFTDDRLGLISTYVNALSTLTIIFVFAHVYSYYNAPFQYASPLGASVKFALLMPAVLAAPVVTLFNFYPRTVLRVLYSRSIALKMDNIKKSMSDKELSEFERLSYLIEYDKTARDELKYRLRITLSDLPFAITIILMAISVLT